MIWIFCVTFRIGFWIWPYKHFRQMCIVKKKKKKKKKKWDNCLKNDFLSSPIKRMPNIRKTKFVLGAEMCNQHRLCQGYWQKYANFIPDGQSLHQWIPLSSMNFCATLEQCFGWLSCWKRWFSPNVLRTKGNSVFLRISSTKKSDFIIPSNITFSVRPLQLMPPHMCTLRGCLGLPPCGINIPFCLYEVVLLLWSCTLHSYVNITLSNDRQKSTRFSWFKFRISWQYLGSELTNPASSMARFTLVLLMFVHDS